MVTGFGMKTLNRQGICLFETNIKLTLFILGSMNSKLFLLEVQ